MAVPHLIPIARMPDDRYAPAAVGRWRGGQFLGYVTGVRQSDVGIPVGDALTRVYAVLHEFDAQGEHIDSTIEAVDTVDAAAWAAAVSAAERLLEEWMRWLPDRLPGDIAVAPFAEHHEGVLFGLVVESHGEYPDGAKEDDWVELYPLRLGFGAPWKGEYDT